MGMFCINCGNKVNEGQKFCVQCGNALGAREGVVTASAGSDVKYEKSSKNRRIGFRIIFTPLVLLLGIIIVWTLTYFVIDQIVNEDQIKNLLLNIANMVLGFFGTLGVFSLPVCIPLGIIFLYKKEIVSGYDQRSGRGELSEMPSEIRGWSWGAAGLGWIWGFYHKVWFSWISFIPLVNIIWLIVAGLKGNEWAWRKNRWENIEKFKKSQDDWGIWGIGFFILGVMSTIFALLSNHQ